MSKKDKKNNSKDLNKNNLSTYESHEHEEDTTTPECDSHNAECKSCRKNNTSSKDLL